MVNQVVAAVGAVPPPSVGAVLDGTLPVRRPPRRPRPVTVLVADPGPDTRVPPLRVLAAAGRDAAGPVSAALLDLGIGRVLRAVSVGQVEDLIAGAVSGDLALISLMFGPVAGRLIRDLRRAGWPAVLAVTADGDPAPVIRAFRAGARGVLRGRPANPAAAGVPGPVHDLTDREIDLLRMVADGRSNRWIGEHLGLPSLTVKTHLARIGRRLGTGDRARMVTLAMRAGVIR